jgi:hypothetical protein
MFPRNTSTAMGRPSEPVRMPQVNCRLPFLPSRFFPKAARGQVLPSR